MDIFDGEFFKGAVDGINNILKGFNKLGKAATAINLFSLIILFFFISITITPI